MKISSQTTETTYEKTSKSSHNHLGNQCAFPLFFHFSNSSNLSSMSSVWVSQTWSSSSISFAIVTPRRPVRKERRLRQGIWICFSRHISKYWIIYTCLCYSCVYIITVFLIRCVCTLHLHDVLFPCCTGWVWGCASQHLADLVEIIGKEMNNYQEK